MPDLLVIVPSRGRPRSIARMLDSLAETARLDTHLHVAVDEDDETLPQYRAVMTQAGREGDVLTVGPRKGLCAWTNEIAVAQAGRYPFLASFGDDHVPVTPGWDRALVRGVQDMGGTGFTYPWDSVREDIPEAVVMSSDIVRALGWMCLPALSHWYPDSAWSDLGRGAGCIRHLRAVLVDHRQVFTGKAPVDRTACDNGRSLDADRDAYYAWRATRMADDVATIVKLRERALQPA